MKQQLKRLARKLANKPVIGPILRTGIALVRFPRHCQFVIGQLPTLLQTISEINHRQTRQDRDRENFDKTAPQSLRQLTRDIAELRRAVDALQRAARSPLTQHTKGTAQPLNGVALCLDETENTQGRVRLEYAPASHVTAVSALEELSLARGTVQHLTISDALERISDTLLKTSVLPYLFELMAPGGHLVAEFTDADALLQGYARGALGADELRRSIFGPDSATDPRRNLLTAQSLVDLLQEAGFVQVEILPMDAETPLQRKVVAQKRGEA